MAPKKSPISHLLFLVTYNSLYYFLGLLLGALVLISPADIIVQALYYTHQYNNIIVIAIVYLVTILIVLFVYMLRLYVTRTVLASIPKNWIPVQKQDVVRSVWDMIRREMGKSAAIAWRARPKIMDLGTDLDDRSLSTPLGLGESRETYGYEGDDGGERAEKRAGGLLGFLPLSWTAFKKEKTATAASELGIELPPTLPVWGHIEHPGWGSPNSADLPNLQYSAVLAELPNLIEAKAVSLAPLITSDSHTVEPAFRSDETTPVGSHNRSLETDRLKSPVEEGEQIAFDPEAVGLLQRTVNMSMRAYIDNLISLGVVPTSLSGDGDDSQETTLARNAAEFIDSYEKARFSTRPLSNDKFRRLMHCFAELLRSMQPLDPAVLETVREMDEMYSQAGSYSHKGSERQSNMADDCGGEDGDGDGDIDDDAPKSFSSSIAPSNRRGQSSSPFGRPELMTRNSSQGTRGKYGTAPTTPQSRAGRSKLGMTAGKRKERSPGGRSGTSVDSFAQTRRPFALSASTPSSGRSQRSLRSVESTSIRSRKSQRSMNSQGTDGSGGSVIRLSRREDGTSMPYILNFTKTL